MLVYGFGSSHIGVGTDEDRLSSQNPEFSSVSNEVSLAVRCDASARRVAKHNPRHLCSGLFGCVRSGTSKRPPRTRQMVRADS